MSLASHAVNRLQDLYRRVYGRSRWLNAISENPWLSRTPRPVTASVEALEPRLLLSDSTYLDLRIAGAIEEQEEQVLYLPPNGETTGELEVGWYDQCPWNAWSLSFPSSVRIERQTPEGWQEIGDHKYAITSDETLNLRITRTTEDSFVGSIEANLWLGETMVDPGVAPPDVVSLAPFIVAFEVHGATDPRSGVLVPLNRGYDENNLGPDGELLWDWQEDAVRGHRIIGDDPDLCDATLSVLADAGAEGTVSFTVPDGLLLWLPGGDQGYLPITASSELTITGSKTFNLKVERILPDEPDGGTEPAPFEITYTPTAGGGSAVRTTSGTITSEYSLIDLDIDSDNDDGYDWPELDWYEDLIEGDPSYPGKILRVNDSLAVPVVLNLPDAGNLDPMSEREFGTTLPFTTPVRFSFCAEALKMTPDFFEFEGRTEDTLIPGKIYTLEQIKPFSDFRGELTLDLWAVRGTRTDEERKITVEFDLDGDGEFEISDSVYVWASDDGAPPVRITGTKWFDENQNGERDSRFYERAQANIVYVIDSSGSTGLQMRGLSNGLASTIFGAEVAAFAGLTNRFREIYGEGQHSPNIGIVTFSGTAEMWDMDPDQSGDQFYTPFLGKVEATLNSLATEPPVGGTDYKSALEKVQDLLAKMPDSPPGGTHVVFLSDGYHNGLSFLELAEALKEATNLRAFGAGEGASFVHLRVLDPMAKVFTTHEPLVQAFGDMFRLDNGPDKLPDTGDERIAAGDEPGLAGWRIYVDANRNGQFDAGEPTALTDQNGNYSIIASEAQLANMAITVNVDGQDQSVIYVAEELRPSWTQTAPSLMDVEGASEQRRVHRIVLTPGMGTVDDINFGNANARIDVDIDSDNSGVVDRSAVEDRIEDDATAPGKEIPENSGDVDGDGLIDLDDMYIEGGQFAPMLVELRASDWSGGTPRIRFDYEGCSPPVPGEPLSRDGLLRVWRKDADVNRQAADYVEPGTEYLATDLGFSEEGLQKEFFVEGIRQIPLFTNTRVVVTVISEVVDNSSPTGATITVTGQDAVRFRVTGPAVAAATGEVSGYVFEDINRNGIWDKAWDVQKDHSIIMAVDWSGSTLWDSMNVPEEVAAKFSDPRNGNRVLDGEVAAVSALIEQCNRLGLGQQVNISIIGHDDTGDVIDMAPNAVLPGMEAAVQADADLDGNGVYDAIDAARSLLTNSKRGGGNDFYAVLYTISTLLADLQPSGATVFFMSDGYDENTASTLSSFREIIESMRQEFQVEFRAVGLGEVAGMERLRWIDPSAFRILNAEDLRGAFSGLGAGEAPEDPLEGHEVYADLDNNGQWDPGEPLARILHQCSVVA